MNQQKSSISLRFITVALFFQFTICLQSLAQSSPPTITSLTPSNSHIGDTVLITGTGFDFNVISNNKVSFVNWWYVSPGVFQYDSIHADIIEVTSTSITARVPMGASYGAISVSSDGQHAVGPLDGYGEPQQFIFSVIPTISNFYPNHGYIGDTITITGTGFDSWHPWVNYVWFTNGNNTYAISATTTSLKVIVPLGTTDGPITVFTNAQKVSSPLNFGVLPATSYLEENQGEVGARVALYGTGFDPAQIANYQLTFNGTPSTITSVYSTFIETTVPFHASTGPIILTYQGNIVKGPSLYFYVIPTQPNIYSYSVYSGAVGTPVTITGSGFDQAGPPLEVYFGGVKAKINNYNQSSIYTTVPLGAQSGPISVTAAGVNTIGFNLTFRVLENVTSMTPRHAKVGDTIIVKGTGFFAYYPNYRVLFPNASSQVIAGTDTTLAFVVPRDATSCIPVIQASFNLNVSVNLPYLRIIPTITRIKPDTAYVGRPNQIITINGSGFGTSYQTKRFIEFNENVLQKIYSVNNSNQIITTLPNGVKTGPVKVTIDSLTAISTFDLKVLPDTFPYKPEAPYFNSTSVTTTSFIEHWSRPYRAIGYLLDVSSDNFATYIPGFKSKFLQDTLQSFSGLSAGTQYDLRIRSISTTDTSSYSYGFTVTIPPPPVAIPPIKLNSLEYVIQWYHSKGATGYLLDVSSDYFKTSLSATLNDTIQELQILKPDKVFSFEYRVRAYNESGYSPYSNIVSVSVITDIIPFAEGANLYPNPSTDFISIAGLNDPIVEATIFDETGKVVISNAQGGDYSPPMINIRSLTEGIYILKLVTIKSEVTFRFTKK